MIQLIVGEKGKGKTKVLLDKVNAVAASANGNVVFVDKDNSHMYELKNTIRLVNTGDYFIDDQSEFVGFIAGIISADHDLEELYIDRLLKVAYVEDGSVEWILDKVAKVCEANNVKCTISVSITKDQVPAKFADAVIEAL